MTKHDVSGPRRLVAEWPRLDLAMAAALVVIAVASAVAGKPDEGPVAVTVPVAAVSGLALVWRSRAPLPAIGVVIAAQLIQSVLADPPGSLWSLAIALILMYSVAAELPEFTAAIGGVAMAGAQCVEERIDNGVDYLFIVIVFGGAWLIGRASRDWRGRATDAEANRDEAARLAVAEERVRIARELHDVVAHGLSVIAVQADAAEAALAHDADLAAAPLRAIRLSAREALSDMRQMLQVLRTEDDEEGPLSPARGLADLPALVGSMVEAGLPLTADLDTSTRPINAATEVTVFRIVQEGLTNVLKHAGSVPTSLAVHVGRDSVEVLIRDQGTRRPDPSTTGRGLVGIAERVAAAGGTVAVGPLEGRGFSVAVSLPTGADPV